MDKLMHDNEEPKSPIMMSSRDSLPNLPQYAVLKEQETKRES